MNKNQINRSSIVKVWLALLVTVSAGVMPTLVNASGGGSVKTYEARVTGYVTAIDYVNSTISIGASYYGSGALNVSSTTKISLDTVSCDLDAIELGDWAEARYDWASRTATKLSVTSAPTS